MLSFYVLLKLVHVIGACVLFGTGLGIAFFMWMANRTSDPVAIAATAHMVVIADVVFTAAAVVVQPLSGAGLAHALHIPLSEPWVAASIALYLAVGACWLPVVRIQIALRDLARVAARDGVALPARYHALYRIWALLGWPAFAGVVAILWLMIAKPSLW
jgi:uncharacterized membrane protein